jgi:hypothetical protein
MRSRLLFALIALSGCTHLPWNPYRGWRVWRTPTVAMYTDTIAQYEPALEWMDKAFAVYKATFFADFDVPPAQVLYFSSDANSPFIRASGTFKYGMTIARSPWAEAHGGKTLVVVGYASWQWRYHHQLAHHFIEAAVPHAPLWFQEGFARYLTSFYGLPNRPQIVCFGRDQPAYTTKVSLPLSDLLGATYHDYNESQEPWVGPLSQSFVDFLIHGEGGRLRGRLTTLMRALARGKTSQEALAEVYPDLPLDRMDELFADHVRRLRAPGEECPLALELRNPPVKVEPIRAPVPEAEAQALVESLQQVREKTGYADFAPDSR